MSFTSEVLAPVSAGTQAMDLQGPTHSQQLMRQLGGAGFEAQQAALSPRQDAAGNPLVGLRRGDGLNFGTFERRPRVTLLQEQLNEKMLAGLDPDGMFGPKTSQVLQEFQLSIGVTPREVVDSRTADALMGTPQKQPPGTTPPGTTPPGPQPAHNPALEDIADAIWLQHQVMLKDENDALNRLESDLQEAEYPDSPVLDLLVKIGSSVIDSVTFGGGSSLKTLITEGIGEIEALDEDAKSLLVSSVVDPVLGDVVAGTAKEKLASKVGELTATDHQNLLSTYIESQRAAITRASEEAQLQFLLHGKPRLRQHVPSDAEAAPGEDRRVTRALAALDKIRSQRGGVNGRQYSESLAGWTHNLAQTRLGRVNGGFFDQPGTNLAKDDSDTVGVLYLEVEGTSPDKKVKVTEAQIEGLSPIVRQKLMKEDPQLRDLDFAIVAELDVDDGDIEIGRNEVNQDFEIDCDNEGRQWLTARHAHEQGLLPDTGTVPTVKGGIRSVMDDVGGTKLSKVPGGLQS